MFYFSTRLNFFPEISLKASNSRILLEILNYEQLSKNNFVLLFKLLSQILTSRNRFQMKT